MQSFLVRSCRPPSRARVGQRLDAPVIAIAAAIEHDLVDAGLDRPLGEQLADGGGGRLVGAGLELSP